MKKLLLLSSVSVLTLFGCGSGNETKDNNKVKISFKPDQGKTVNIDYQFSVTQTTSGDVSSFDMHITGKTETAADGKVTLELKNQNLSMTGSIAGKPIHGSAEGPDSLTGDAKLVALPVFTLSGKSYRSIYNPQFDKRTEVQINGNDIVDSTENKLQFLVRYPVNEISVGDSWNKEILVRTGNKMNCNAKYTLTKISGDTATITMEGKLSGNGEKFGNEFTMDGTIKGEFEVDTKTGWPIDTDTHQEFTLHMGGKDIPMKYDIKCKVNQQ